mmetsp:Transcript_31838/g.102835  ORF Transcript_31838/g.102835 Transcript_31838/m.102835 type:complete len:270 (+) Transcript_31838:1783-2592(+)
MRALIGEDHVSLVEVAAWHERLAQVEGERGGEIGAHPASKVVRAQLIGELTGGVERVLKRLVLVHVDEEQPARHRVRAVARRGSQQLGKGQQRRRVDKLAFGLAVEPLAVFDGPARGAFHLAEPAPRAHDGDGRDSADGVGLVPHGLLPLAIGVLLLRIGQREALQEQEDRELLEQGIILLHVHDEDDVLVSDGVYAQPDVGVIALEPVPADAGIPELLRAGVLGVEQHVFRAEQSPCAQLLLQVPSYLLHPRCIEHGRALANCSGCWV